ncbi:MAG: thioesterase family protein [bacterium]
MDGYRFTMEKRVRYSETDAVGIANNLSFFRYFEIGRTEYWRSMDAILPEIERKTLGIVMVHQECDYRLPAYPDELLEVGVRTASVGETSIVTEYRLHRKETNEVIAEGNTVHVTMDAQTRKPVPVPDPIREKLSRFENKSF